MPVDPFTALGVAGNIIQFLDFSCKLISKGKEIYTSGEGASAVSLEIEVIHEDLCNVANALGPQHTISAQDIHLQQLAKACQDVAQDLLNTVRSLKVDPQAQHRKWKSFRQALKSVWKQSRIEDLEARLDSFRKQLTLHLVLSIGDGHAQIHAQIHNFQIENTRMDLDQTQKLDELKEDVKSLQLAIEPLRNQVSTSAVDVDLQELLVKVQHVAIQGATVTKHHRILSSLCYSYMTTRNSNIAEAYRETFDWIFDVDSDIGFVDWLHRGRGIFWVAGKPGSGKSTLMKYLFQHPKALDGLRKWAGEMELVVANFFFWSIGTLMQKSQEGLLRSLILAILKQCPEIISKTCPYLWNSDEYGETGEVWTLSELKQTISRIVQHEDRKRRFVFFIDGLDEYEGHHADIVAVLNTLVKSESIKICVSSRSWQVFEDAYGANAANKLYLEDLTREDIKLYVRSELEEPSQGALLSLGGDDFDDLAEEIVDRAKGVFLWVYFAMRSLQEGLTAGDDVDGLRVRLSEIPDDLENYFRVILNSVEAVYKEKMALTFQLILQVSEPLTLMSLSFIEQRRADYALDQPVKIMDKYEIFDRHRKMRTRINGRYKNMLYITPDPSAIDFFGFRVDFFHRTVHDFMRLNDVQRYLGDRLPRGFDAHLATCEMLLVTFKRMPIEEKDLRSPGSFQDMLGEFMYHARQMELKTSQSPIELLDELEYTVTCISQTHDVERIVWERKGTTRSVNERCRTFFEFAVRSCLQLYVQTKVGRQPYFARAYSRPLLHLVLRRLFDVSSNRIESFHVQGMAEYLLDNGADPDQLFMSSTVFGEFLHKLINKDSEGVIHLAQSGEIFRQQFSLFVLLLEHGADPNARFTQAHNQLADFFPSYEQGLNSTRTTTVWGHLAVGICQPHCLVHRGTDLMKILRVIIQYGGNPNKSFNDEEIVDMPAGRIRKSRRSTIWSSFLYSLATHSDHYSSTERRMLADAAKHFILAGASVETTVEVNGIHLSPGDVVQKAFPKSLHIPLLDLISKRRKHFVARHWESSVVPRTQSAITLVLGWRPNWQYWSGLFYRREINIIDEVERPATDFRRGRSWWQSLSFAAYRVAYLMSCVDEPSQGDVEDQVRREILSNRQERYQDLEGNAV
ncbi:hypothetical protein BDV96DRAFT_522208 [Lophiotrema nucula]|uniref:NACHT domain-containing protein n=1 Tax=Lophiotrema nucula TaxID=690887 RepID=A0A6A5Z598_9PLEO|nr:hypothetical protein BDV96DRAFT_522208 [Lophiotrema nucula]